MTSPSMPVSSDRLSSLRRPSDRRPIWITTLIADAICARADRAGMSIPLMPIICSTRDKASRGGIGVDGGHRAVVAGIHRLQHVERFAGADLADDDPVGAHAQRVLDQFALGDLAPALDIRRPRLQPHDMLLLQLELGRVLDGDDALAIVDEGRHGIEHGRLAGTGTARNEDVAARADDRPQNLGDLGGTLPISISRSMLIGTRANLRIDSSDPSIASGGTTALTRLPSASRASTIGEDSSIRRPTAETIFWMMRIRCLSSLNRTLVRSSTP